MIVPEAAITQATSIVPNMFTKLSAHQEGKLP